MRKTLLITSLLAMAAILTACGNTDSTVSDAVTTPQTDVAITTTVPEPPEDVTTTTTAVSIEETTTPAESVTTTTTVTTEVVTTTTPEVTTTPEPTTTTAKTTTKAKTTTTAKKTTTTAKTTTTKKKTDDSKYKLTGILASYDRLNRNCPTDKDIELIKEDIIQYAMYKYNGKSGKLEFNPDGPDAEALKYFGVDPTRELKTMDVTVTIKLTGSTNLGWEDCRRNYAAYSAQNWDESWGWDAEQTYWQTRFFRSQCYGIVDAGLYSLLYKSLNYPVPSAEAIIGAYIKKESFGYMTWFADA